MHSDQWQKPSSSPAPGTHPLQTAHVNQHQGFFLTRELSVGFLAPLESLRFFANHKMVMLMGLAPFVVGLVCYFWAFSVWALPWLLGVFSSWGWDPSGTGMLVSLGLTAFAYLCAFLLFSLVGMPLVTVLASPLFDMIAEKAFVASGNPLRPHTLTARLFLRSFLNEFLKTVLFVSCVTLGFFVPLFVPFALIISLWFFGWDHMDRTLALFHLSLGRRLWFGLRHFLACVSLGVWRYVPFVGTLFSFVMSAAGALAVARIARNAELKPHAAEPKLL